MARRYQPRYNPATLPVYGRMLAGARRRPRVGETYMLPDGRHCAILDICGDLARVKFESGHTAQINLDLLEVSR